MKKTQVNDEFIRKRIERQRRIRKRRLLIFFFCFTVLLICVGIALCFTVFFPIERLSASGSAIYDSKQIINAAELEIGDNLFAISKSTVLKKLQKQLPYIESVELKRKLPSELNIKVKDAEEFAAYHIKNQYYIVSQSGWVLTKQNEASEKVPEILGVAAACEVGTEIEFKNSEQKDLIEQILQSLSAEELSIDYIDISDTLSLKVGVEGRFVVNIGTSNNIEEKIKHLAGMVESIPNEKRGKINLSMWTTDNTQGTFTAENAE